MRYPFPSTLLLLALIPAVAAAQNPPTDLSDPEVAHVAVTADNIDIDFGKLALSRTKDSEVKNFASMMVRDHTGVNEKATALAKKLGVTPKDNAVSQSLESGAKEAKAKLDPSRGRTSTGPTSSARSPTIRRCSTPSTRRSSPPPRTPS